MDLNNQYIFDGGFGLERETLRVNSSGELSKTEHPFLNNPSISRDFCENQLEIITPVCSSIDELFVEFKKLDLYAKSELLKKNEYLWMYSNPPHFKSDDDIFIAQFTGDESYKKEYRENLEKRYGKQIMLFSGIHFNFSYSDVFINSVYDGKSDFIDFKNNFYFKLLKQLSRYSWLLVFLTAASPVYDKSLDNQADFGTAFNNYSSLRNSQRGYWNKFLPVMDYNDFNRLIKSINSFVKNGFLFSPAELYLPIRLKPPKNNDLNSMLNDGVNHIELRMFDVNPLSELGIFKETIEFVHYFILYLTMLPDFDFTKELQVSAITNHKNATIFPANTVTISGYNICDAALGILNDMKIYFRDFKNILDNINLQISKIENNDFFSNKIYELLKDNYHDKMLSIIKSQNHGKGL